MKSVPTRAELVDLFWRSLWTFISAAGAGLAGTGLLDLTAIQAAGMAGLTAVLNVVLVFARQKAGTVPSARQAA